jgi:hypothetical protein
MAAANNTTKPTTTNMRRTYSLLWGTRAFVPAYLQRSVGKRE